MSFSLHSLKGIIYGIIQGSIIGAVRGIIGFFDYS